MSRSHFLPLLAFCSAMIIPGLAGQARAAALNCTHPTTAAEILDCGDARPAPKASGPSFNCAKASTGAEKMICKNAALAKADLAVATAYKRALGSLDPGAAKALAEDQRSFVAVRDEAVDAGFQDVGDAKDIGERLKRRVKFLNALQPQAPGRWAGQWQNSSGGFDITANPDGSLKMSASTSEGVSARWVCDVEEATGTIAGDVVTVKSDGDEGSLLRLSREGQTLKVTFEPAPGATSKAPPYCGSGGTLEGTYFAFPADYKP